MAAQIDRVLLRVSATLATDQDLPCATLARSQASKPCLALDSHGLVLDAERAVAVGSLYLTVAEAFHSRGNFDSIIDQHQAGTSQLIKLLQLSSTFASCFSRCARDASRSAALSNTRETDPTQQSSSLGVS